MRLAAPLASLLLFAACGDRNDVPAASDNAGGNAALPPLSSPASDADAATGGWVLEPAAGGPVLALRSAGEETAIRLSCSAGRKLLLIHVPGFRGIGSEDRLSFGGGGEAVALVAAVPRHAGQAGVSAAGPLPDDLAALLAAPLSASYGAQTSGPHPAPPPDLARAFIAACTGGAAGTDEPPRPNATAGVSACLMQGGERLQVATLRAVGTEPFWGARIEGRCVTYSHPEDQAGTRVWTRYAPAPGGGTWTGALDGQRFELRTRAAPGCSDGMSDRRYPIAVDLLVGGERRRGCAAPQ